MARCSPFSWTRLDWIAACMVKYQVVEYTSVLGSLSNVFLQSRCRYSDVPFHNKNILVIWILVPHDAQEICERAVEEVACSTIMSWAPGRPYEPRKTKLCRP
jgi:hypothetical protein